MRVTTTRKRTKKTLPYVEFWSTAFARRTSASDPIRVDWLPLDDEPGRLGITLLPGKRVDTWDRDLDADLDVLDAMGNPQDTRVLIPGLKVSAP